MKTQTIAGHEITLEPGRKYIATRRVEYAPADRFRIFIRNVGDGGEVVHKIEGLSYYDAGVLLDNFNTGPSVFDYRTW